MNTKRQTITSRSGKASQAAPVQSRMLSREELKRRLSERGEKYPEAATLEELASLYKSKFQEN